MNANIGNLYNKKKKDNVGPIGEQIQSLYSFMDEAHAQLLPPQIDQLNRIIEKLQAYNIEIIQGSAE